VFEIALGNRDFKAKKSSLEEEKKKKKLHFKLFKKVGSFYF
jgi:hypothetical protein